MAATFWYLLLAAGIGLLIGLPLEDLAAGIRRRRELRRQLARQARLEAEDTDTELDTGWRQEAKGHFHLTAADIPELRDRDRR